MSDDLRAIERLLVEYAGAIDAAEFDRLDEVFVPDASIDFRPVGGRHGTFFEIKPWLVKRMSRFVALQHLLGNFVIEVDGDVATSRAYVRATHVHGEPGALVSFEIGGVYEDRLVRTSRGFRIAERTLRHVFTTGTLPSR